MASPFHVFRRHQKVLMAIACVVGIFAFVLDDTLRSLMGGTAQGSSGTGNRPSAKAVAVHWNGGRLTNADLDKLVFRRRVVANFQKQIYEMGTQRERILVMTTGATPRQLTVQPVIGPDRLEEGVERDVVRVQIFSDAARDAGMTVSNEEILHYLFELGRERVSTEEMQTLMRRSTSGYSVSAEFVFAALRDELLARYYLNSYLYATSAVMPEQQWQDWLRVNDRVSIEAAAIPTESFLVDAKEPTDAELSEYYDKFKEAEPRPDIVDNVELPSPNPAFKIPRKVELQYLRADAAKLLAQMKNEITDEEVQKYYDEKKDPYYIKLDTGLLDKSTDSEKKSDSETKQEPSDGKQPAATDPATKSDDATKGNNTGTGATPTQPPASGERQQPAAPATPGAGKSAPEAGKESAVNTPFPAKSPAAPIRLVAFEQPATGAKAGTTTAGAPTQPATAPATTNAAQPTQTKADETKAGAATADAAQPATGTTILTPADKAEETPKKPVEFMPLDDELRNKIREQLAMPKVNGRLDQITGELYTKLKSEYSKYRRAEIDAVERKQPAPTPPAALTDLSTLVTQPEVEFHKVGPISQYELRDDKVLGQLTDVEQSGQPLFGAPLFGKDPEIYKIIKTVDVDNNRYIMVKTGDTPARVPTLAEIRDAVVKAWKLGKASEAALKHAQAEATKAQDARTPLSEYFASNPAIKVIKTDPFSWVTGGEVFQISGQLQRRPYRMSEPNDIVAPDLEFMKTIFDLDEGQVAAVLNHDHSMAYVVRVVDHQYTQEKLHEQYLGEAYLWTGLPVMTSGHAQSATSALVASLLEDAGYKEDRSLAPRDSNEE